MNIKVPDKVTYIIRILKEHGYEAYAVGGCVRDSILGRIPGDWDITTSASPLEVKELFSRTIDTGIQHGTVTVMIEREGFEVTTYRLDGEYEDCRHPKQVEFTKSLREDLKRRDFTINAMAYNDEDGMVDLFQGIEDIQNRSIRCVGYAEDRFEEDALRMLRAVRFSAQLGFEIEEHTKAAIAKKVNNLTQISAERIREELNKIFRSNHPERLKIAYELGITKIVLPEFDQKMQKQGLYHSNEGYVCLEALKLVQQIAQTEHIMWDYSQKEQILRKLTAKEGLCLSYAVLLQSTAMPKHTLQTEVAADEAKKTLQRLKFDNETIHCVMKLVKYADYKIEDNDISVRKAMHHMGSDLMDLWFLLQRVNEPCRLLEQKSQTDETNIELTSLYERYTTIMVEKHCVCLKDLKINGKDLIQLGCQPGVRIGELLDRLLQHVIQNPKQNERSLLISQAKDWI